MEAMAAAALRFAEEAFAVVGLFLFSQGLVLLLMSGSEAAAADPHEGNAVLRTMFSALHAASLLWVLAHARAAARAVRGRLALPLLLGLAVASTAWSAAPGLTLRRSLALVGTTAFGVFLATRFDTPRLLRHLATALGAAAVLSVAFAVALPAYGVSGGEHAGDWQGIFTHKNMLGQAMVLGTLAFVHLRALLSGGRRWIATGGALLCAALVLMSSSKTALAALLGVLAAAAVFRVLRWKPTLAVAALTGVVLAAGSAAVVAATYRDAILVGIGKDPTLTGRTDIWDALLESIARRPLLGYGYNGYWLGEDGPAAETLAAIGWHTPSAHNGFLEVSLQLGLVGLGILLFLYLGWFRRAFVAVRNTTSADGLWPATYATFILLYNLTESVLLDRNNLYWALFVAVACSPLLREPAAPLPQRGHGWSR
jgi:O-antigen ligase